MSKAFRLGAFIIATFLIFGAGIFWIGSKRFLFSSTYTLNADFENVAGLTDGAEVRVNGIQVDCAIAVVILLRAVFYNRREPQRGYAEILKVGKMVADTAQISAVP